MTESATRIVLNISGTRFEVTPQTLAKLPTLANSLWQNGDELFVQRSPLVFEEVLAFVLDEKHPFPACYAYELDYYGIVYDSRKLEDSMMEKLRQIEYKLILLRSAIWHNGRYNSGTWCLKNGCKIMVYGTAYCDQHKDQCVIDSCTSCRQGNAVTCAIHGSPPVHCPVDGCVFRCCVGQNFCANHDDGW